MPCYLKEFSIFEYMNSRVTQPGTCLTIVLVRGVIGTPHYQHVGSGRMANYCYSVGHKLVNKLAALPCLYIETSCSVKWPSLTIIVP